MSSARSRAGATADAAAGAAAGPSAGPDDAGDDAGDIRSIAVIRALNLGDLLCAQPSLRALRRRYPAARIRLIGLPWASVLVDRWPDLLDDHAAFPGFPGIPEAPFEAARTLAFLRAVQADPPDLAVQLHGDGTTINAFVGMLGARRVAGFVPPGVAGLADPPDGTWVAYPGHGSEVHRLLAIPAALGASTDDDRLTFPVRDGDRQAVERTAGQSLGDEPFVVVHPGSSTPTRRWPAERFAAIADGLVADGLRVVLTGSDAERPIAAAVTAGMRAPALDLSGRTALGELAALLDRAELLVVNDTGVSHLAAALGTRSVVIFNGSDAERWAPLDRTRHIAVGAMAASSCRHDPADPDRCLGDACTLGPRSGHRPDRQPATVDEVLAAARDLLTSARVPVSSPRAG